MYEIYVYKCQIGLDIGNIIYSSPRVRSVWFSHNSRLIYWRHSVKMMSQWRRCPYNMPLDIRFLTGIRRQTLTSASLYSNKILLFN